MHFTACSVLEEGLCFVHASGFSFVTFCNDVIVDKRQKFYGYRK